MEPKILVAYASKHGATTEIAEQIGKVLTAAGLVVDVRPGEQVNDLKPYQAIILGSAVYIGQWRKEAANFLTTYASSLAERAVWLFSTGPTGQGDPASLMKGWRFPTGLQPIADRIHPRDIALFGGDIALEKLNIAEKLIVKGVKAPSGDYRNWDAINAWTKSIATLLQKEASQPIAT